MTRDDSVADLEAAGRLLLDNLARGAARAEGVGILRSWRNCSTGQARRDLYGEHGSHGQDAEAARLAAVVDADARGRADPDWR